MDELRVTTDVEGGKRNLDEHGYTIHPGFIDRDTVKRLRDRLLEQAELEREAGVATISSTGHAGSDRHVGGLAPGALPVSQQVSFLPNKGAALRETMHHPIAIAYARHAFREVPFNIVTMSALFLRNGGRRQVLHADQQALPFLTPMPVMINVTICLSDYEAAMGATNVVPGSHRHPSPDLALDADEAARSIGSRLLPMEAEAGSALIFESRTWHCQGTHTSDKLRLAIANVYGLHFMKPQDIYPAIVHDDVYPQLSEDDRAMLGFGIAFEYAGRIGPRYPGDTRRNTNVAFPYIPELRRGGDKLAVPAEGGGVAKADVLAAIVA